MAYTTQSDVEIAAGGAPLLVKLTDHERNNTLGEGVLARAQEEADRWIDRFAWKLYSKSLPFDPVPTPIRDLAAAETVYRLKVYLSTTTEEDRLHHEARQKDLEKLETGKWNPFGGGDPYPIADGGGTPTATVRTREGDPFSRDGFRGFI